MTELLHWFGRAVPGSCVRVSHYNIAAPEFWQQVADITRKRRLRLSVVAGGADKPADPVAAAIIGSVAEEAYLSGTADGTPVPGVLPRDPGEWWNHNKVCVFERVYTRLLVSHRVWSLGGGFFPKPLAMIGSSNLNDPNKHNQAMFFTLSKSQHDALVAMHDAQIRGFETGTSGYTFQSATGNGSTIQLMPRSSGDTISAFIDRLDGLTDKAAARKTQVRVINPHWSQFAKHKVNVANKLAVLADNGADIRIISRKCQTAGLNLDFDVWKIFKAHPRIHHRINTEYNHAKYLIVEGPQNGTMRRTVISGTANFTTQVNDRWDSLVEHDSASCLKEFRTHFDDFWVNRSTPPSEAHGCV